MVPHYSCPEPAFDESFYIPSPDPLTFLENYKLFSKTSFKYYYHDTLWVFPGFFCFKLHVCMCMHACVMCTHTMCGCQRTISNCSSPSTLTEILSLVGHHHICQDNCLMIFQEFFRLHLQTPCRNPGITATHWWTNLQKVFRSDLNSSCLPGTCLTHWAISLDPAFQILIIYSHHRLSYEHRFVCSHFIG